MKKTAFILSTAILVTGCLGQNSETSETAETFFGAAELDALLVSEEADYRTGYDRELFPHWEDTNGSGCTAREDMVKEAAIGLPQIDIYDPCKVVEGDFHSVYDGETLSGHPSAFDLDHIVALAEAWDSGADQWDRETRREFANDPDNLILVSASSNREKSADDAAEWAPYFPDTHCAFAAAIVHVKGKYNLSVDGAEKAALRQMLETC